MAAAARRVVATYAPDIKAALYATGLAKLFVLELGPLLTVRGGLKACKSPAAIGFDVNEIYKKKRFTSATRRFF
jgi:hypothetical protein